jgi:hypothetical protein
MQNKNIVTVARMWYKLGKEAYFGLKHLTETFPEIEFDFHLIINEYDYKDEYTDKIKDLKINLTLYRKEFFIDYLKLEYSIDDNYLVSMINLPHIYHILIGHYLKRVKLVDYMISYEYDVVFPNKDITELRDCLIHKIPFGIIEPHNPMCDKSIFQQLCNLFGTDLRGSIRNIDKGINAGFQGINLKLFNEFLSQSNFKSLLDIFDTKSLVNEDGTKRLEGWDQTLFETQEQSFYSLLNQIYSYNFKILNIDQYYFWPCWDGNTEFVQKSLKSKVLHFTGHQKSVEWYRFMDNYLQHEQ